MPRRKVIGYLVSTDPLLQQPRYPIFEGGINIGREASRCEIILSRDYVSRMHCRVDSNGNGLTISDLNTTNGTFVNGGKIRSQPLHEGDKISLGRPDLHHFVFTQTAAPWSRVLVLQKQPVYRIGRSRANDLPLTFDPTVSNLHARLRLQSGSLILEDLRSANGTFVNGLAVTSAAISSEDSVQIGSCELQFEISRDALRVSIKENRNQIRLEAHNLFRESKGRTLLQNITLAIEPGEFVGVLGPSGAGKSTLLGALNGFHPADRGHVLLNTESLYDAYEMFRTSIGYVPQDDIIHRDLTVERSLLYTAQLRLPRDTTREQLNQHVTSVIETLGLDHVRRNLVANLSGGQRKRVSIGCELLTKPSLIYLDEPTSGLDPSTEERLMRHFRQMSEQGQTVILTTHILYNLELLDLVVLLARGRLVYFGPTDQVCRFFSTDNFTITRPVEIFEVLDPDSSDIAERESRAKFFEQKYVQSDLYHRYVTKRCASGSVPGPNTENSGERPRKRPRLRREVANIFSVTQFVILVRRAFDLRVSVPERLIVPLLTPILLALLTSTIEITPPEKSLHDPRNPDIPISLPLTLTMTSVFLGTLAACLEISGERAIYLRERAVNLAIPTYVAGKLPPLCLLTTVQCFIYVTIVFLLLQPPDINVLGLAISCTALAWVSCTTGLFISSLDPTPGQNSVILAIVVVLPQMVLCGAMPPAYYGGMGDTARFIANLLPARWGFELLLQLIYPDNAIRENLVNQLMGFGAGIDVARRTAVAFLAQALGYFLLTLISLKRYDRL